MCKAERTVSNVVDCRLCHGRDGTGCGDEERLQRVGKRLAELIQRLVPPRGNRALDRSGRRRGGQSEFGIVGIHGREVAVHAELLQSEAYHLAIVCVDRLAEGNCAVITILPSTRAVAGVNKEVA